MKLSLLHKEIIKWSVYWAVVMLVYTVMSVVYGNGVLFLPVLVFALVNFALRLACILPTKRIVARVTRRIVVIALNVVFISAVILSGYILLITGFDNNYGFIKRFDYSVFEHTSEYRYDEATGVYTVTSKNDEFKILQLTDVHICGGVATSGLDKKAFTACYTLIERAQPDLIIVTGDMVYPFPLSTFNINNGKPFKQFCYFMNSVGIPWALVYGNHDLEGYATHGIDDFDKIISEFKAQGAPMLYADKRPDIDGRYNQYIRVENGDGSLNRVLFLMDSNSYAEVGGYDNVHANQIEWYRAALGELREKEGDVRSFVYMHIPFREFVDAWNGADSGAADAKYMFGSNKEDVCCSKENSGFFDAILAENSTEAVFVGHDHVNTMAVEYKGVDLVYSMSIDYSAYPRIAHSSEQRGATLVTLSYSGEYDIRQMPLE